MAYMNEDQYQRWLSQFVMFGGEAYTKEEWEYHPNNPDRKKRGRHRPADRQTVKGVHPPRED